MANAQCQFTQGATVGGDGQSVLGFVSSTLITMTDEGGAGATSYAWEILNWPAPLSSAPVITNSTSQVATVTPTTAGVYIVKLTRTDVNSGTTTDTQFIGVADDEGHHLPVAGMSGNMTNVGASPTLAQAAGWMGREDASTNVLLDAYLRWLKTAAKNVQSFPLVSGKQVALSDSWRVVGSLQLDPSGYPSYATAAFQVALSVTSGQTAEVRLYNVTDGGVVSSSTQTSTSTTTEVKSATVTLPSAEKLYEVHLRLANPNGGSDEAVCSEARLILA
jgi:PKD repeat protein